MTGRRSIACLAPGPHECPASIRADALDALDALAGETT